MIKDWTTTTLGEVANYIANGRAFKPAEWEDNGLPIIRIQNLNNPEATYNYSTKSHEDKYKVKRNDLLFAWSASLGSYIWKGNDAWLNQHIFRVEPKNFIKKHFLHYFFEKIIRELYSKSHGSGMVHVTKGKFVSTEISLPPLPEQRAIVTKIEQLFSELDNGLANLKTAQDQLKVYRQAVLKKAFEGDLTKEWRESQSLPTADDLLTQIKTERANHYKKQLDDWKQAVNTWEANGKDGKKPTKPKQPKELPPLTEEELEKLPELPDGWDWVKIGEILENDRTCAYGVLQPGQHFEDGINLIRVGDINNGKINTENLKKIKPEISSKYKRTLLQGGEMLLSLVGAIGRTAIVPKTLKDSNTARAVGVIPLSKLLNNKYVELFFRAEHKIQELNSLAHEVARKTLNLEDVRNATVAIPPFEEQHQIVQEIESRLSVCDKVEESIKESLLKAEALRQSILKKAFEGNLLSDADLAACRQEPDWEPAEKLLERIRAEKNK